MKAGHQGNSLKWETGIWRSSEVIRGQTPPLPKKKMTNRKIFYSTLFMQGASGTLNKDRGLLFFHLKMNYIYLKNELHLTSKWPQNDL